MTAQTTIHPEEISSLQELPFHGKGLYNLKSGQGANQFYINKIYMPLIFSRGASLDSMYINMSVKKDGLTIFYIS